MLLSTSRGPKVLESVAVIMLAFSGSTAFAVTQAEVDKLNAQCEAARAEQLAPLREQKTRECIEQKIKAPDHCKRYYTTYGNNSVSGGRRTQGMFYDLPQCQTYLDARADLEASRR